MFYEFRQIGVDNYFVQNDQISLHVFIEAKSLEQAKERAKEWANIVIDSFGYDCDAKWLSCCEAVDDDVFFLYIGKVTKPLIYGCTEIKDYDISLMDYYPTYAIVYFEKDNGKPTKVNFKFEGEENE